jgi:hypothetical protein
MSSVQTSQGDIGTAAHYDVRLRVVRLQSMKSGWGWLAHKQAGGVVSRTEYTCPLCWGCGWGGYQGPAGGGERRIDSVGASPRDTQPELAVEAAWFPGLGYMSVMTAEAISCSSLLGRIRLNYSPRGQTNGGQLGGEGSTENWTKLHMGNQQMMRMVMMIYAFPTSIRDTAWMYHHQYTYTTQRLGT